MESRSKDEQNPSLLFCPSCGCSFPLKDTVTDQAVKSKLNPTDSNTTRIISARKKRRYFDTMWHEIPQYDKEAMNDLAAGRKIVYYNEQKAEEPKKETTRSQGEE